MNGPDHAYSPTCGCPGCQFMWAAEQCFIKNGPPPVMDTFEPTLGDIARDCDHPLSPYRTWTGDRWHPYFEVAPRETVEDCEARMLPR